MSIQKAHHILEREWGNLSNYFEECGYLGNLNLEDIRRNSACLSGGGEWFISNLISMEDKLPQYGYSTPEAVYILTVLASIAANKLGLDEELAYDFGISYAFARTGLLSYHHTLHPRQVLFSKIFYPFGVVAFQWDLNSEFDQSLIKKKLQIVFDKFKSWQSDPRLYDHDLFLFQSMGEVWKAWDEI